MSQHNGLIQYCRDFVKELLKDYPSKSQFSGQDILNFSPIKEFNLIIVQNLLIQWKIEMNELRSPYFNFHAKEVQEALQKFANVLSRNISVERESFILLAEKSAIQTILLFASPYDYFNRLVKREEMKQLNLDDFKETIKYVKINKHVLERFIDELEKKGAHTVYGANDVLEDVFENLSTAPADPQPHLENFSKILKLTEDTIFEPKENTRKIPENKPKEPESSVSESHFNKPSSNPAKDGNEDDYKGALNEKFTADRKTTLADINSKQQLQSLRKSITLNQRFMFINILFDGNEGQFNEAIDKLENCSSLAEAKSYLGNFNMDQNSEEFEEFEDLLKRKFD